jgi:hypothetical protein
MNEESVKVIATSTMEYELVSEGSVVAVSDAAASVVGESGHIGATNEQGLKVGGER